MDLGRTVRITAKRGCFDIMTSDSLSISFTCDTPLAAQRDKANRMRLNMQRLAQADDLRRP